MPLAETPSKAADKQFCRLVKSSFSLDAAPEALIKQVANKVPNVEEAALDISLPIVAKSPFKSPVSELIAILIPSAILPAVIPRSPSPAAASNSPNFTELLSSAAATCSSALANSLRLA